MYPKKLKDRVCISENDFSLKKNCFLFRIIVCSIPFLHSIIENEFSIN